MNDDVTRREMLRLSFGGLGLLAASGNLAACGSDPGNEGPAPRMVSNIANLGPLGEADANGVRLPPGFTSKILARSDEAPIGGAEFVWHRSPDGGATFPTSGGGWIYVSNSEGTDGGVGALEFNAQGQVVDAYNILSGTKRNCAGGATPWGTWLSCEEVADGRVWECDPTGQSEAVVRDALGVFNHEAVAVDPIREHLYLTEDRPNGRLYRFKSSLGLPDLTAGTMEVLRVLEGNEGAVEWLPLPDPSAAETETREQVPDSSAFNGGEGIWYHENVVYFATKGDNRVWALDVDTQEIWVLYDDDNYSPATLSGVDNVLVGSGSDVLVAEDGGDMQIIAITAQNTIVPIMQIEGQPLSEITGPAFDLSGTRLYFSSQRGEFFLGITYEITGPFLVEDSE